MQPRAVIDAGTVHVPDRVRRYARSTDLTIDLRAPLDDILAACAARDWTWITPSVAAAWQSLDRVGHVRSCGAYRGGELVAGLWGLEIGSTDEHHEHLPSREPRGDRAPRPADGGARRRARHDRPRLPHRPRAAARRDRDPARGVPATVRRRSGVAPEDRGRWTYPRGEVRPRRPRPWTLPGPAEPGGAGARSAGSGRVGTRSSSRPHGPSGWLPPDGRRGRTGVGAWGRGTTRLLGSSAEGPARRRSAVPTCG